MQITGTVEIKATKEFTSKRTGMADTLTTFIVREKTDRPGGGSAVAFESTSAIMEMLWQQGMDEGVTGTLHFASSISEWNGRIYNHPYPARFEPAATAEETPQNSPQTAPSDELPF